MTLRSNFQRTTMQHRIKSNNRNRHYTKRPGDMPTQYVSKQDTGDDLLSKAVRFLGFCMVIWGNLLLAISFWMIWQSFQDEDFITKIGIAIEERARIDSSFFGNTRVTKAPLLQESFVEDQLPDIPQNTALLSDDDLSDDTLEGIRENNAIPSLSFLIACVLIVFLILVFCSVGVSAIGIGARIVLSHRFEERLALKMANAMGRASQDT